MWTTGIMPYGIKTSRHVKSIKTNRYYEKENINIGRQRDNRKSLVNIPYERL